MTQLKPIALVSWEAYILRRLGRVAGGGSDALAAALDIALDLIRIEVEPARLPEITQAFDDMLKRLRGTRKRRRFVPQHEGRFNRAKRALKYQKETTAK